MSLNDTITSLGTSIINLVNTRSKTDLSNITTAGENVIKELSGGSSRNIGEIVVSTLPLTDSGLHLLDGALIVGGGIYDNFVQYIGNKYTEETIPADGTAWSTSVQVTNLGSYNWRSVAYGNDKFVTISESGYISISTDGVTWTTAAQNMSNRDQNWFDLVYDGTKFVALDDHGYISTSTDGVTWTTAIRVSELGSNYWKGIAYGNNKFIALGQEGYMSSSTDGTAWATATQILTADEMWTRVVYGNNKFVAISTSGGISTSVDGVTWTTATRVSELGSNSWFSLTYDGTKFVALSQTGYISTSVDGVTWTTAVQNANLGAYSAWIKIAYGNGTYIALNSNSYVSTSVASTPDYFCTESEWQTAVTTYGVCGKLVYDSENNTVRLPKYNSKIYTGGGTASVVGNGLSLGLTDGTSNAGLMWISGNNQGHTISTTSGYGKNIGVSTTWSYSGLNTNKVVGVTTDSTKSGLVAQLSNITTSLDGYYYIVVATSTKTDIQVDIDEIATDLNGKADVGLTNVSNTSGLRRLVEVSPLSILPNWYKVYQEYDKTTGSFIGLWCEMGGLYYKGSTMAGTDNTINFSKTFINTKYTFIPTPLHSTANLNQYQIYEKYTSRTTSSTVLRITAAIFGYAWAACGYIGE